MAFAASVKNFDVAQFDAFCASATDLRTLSLCPEIRLRIATNLPVLWSAQEQDVRAHLPPPYWGIAWPGGQALARYVLDNPATVRGRRVLDLGAGSGICAIAAALAGAHVDAIDVDPAACRAIEKNSELNEVTVTVAQVDPMDSPSRWDVVLAADLWYERFMAARVTSWLRDIAAQGTQVLLGDLGRAYFPRLGVIGLQRYRIIEPAATGRAAEVDVGAWRLVSSPSGLPGSRAEIAFIAGQP
jgi:predicted nicotinamide N-methyase